MAIKVQHKTRTGIQVTTHYHLLDRGLKHIRVQRYEYNYNKTLVYQEIQTPVICPKILDLQDGYSGLS